MIANEPHLLIDRWQAFGGGQFVVLRMMRRSAKARDERQHSSVGAPMAAASWHTVMSLWCSDHYQTTERLCCSRTTVLGSPERSECRHMATLPLGASPAEARLPRRTSCLGAFLFVHKLMSSMGLYVYLEAPDGAGVGSASSQAVSLARRVLDRAYGPARPLPAPVAGRASGRFCRSSFAIPPPHQRPTEA